MIIYEEIVGANYKAIKRTNEDGSQSWIPLDEANSDYQRYLRWLENPNEAEQSTPIVTNEAKTK